VADLTAVTPCDGLLPITRGDLTLTEGTPGWMTLIAVYKRQKVALSEALRAAHGLRWPDPGQVSGTDARLIWFGMGQAMLLGPVPADALKPHAALTDQSDGWALVELRGPGASDVLARLVPIDLRASVFGEAQTARTMLGHMNVSLTAVQGGYDILAFRSMAKTLVHDLDTAMSLWIARSQG